YGGAVPATTAPPMPSPPAPHKPAATDPAPPGDAAPGFLLDAICSGRRRIGGAATTAAPDSTAPPVCFLGRFFRPDRAAQRPCHPGPVPARCGRRRGSAPEASADRVRPLGGRVALPAN